MTVPFAYACSFCEAAILMNSVTPDGVRVKLEVELSHCPICKTELTGIDEEQYNREYGGEEDD